MFITTGEIVDKLLEYANIIEMTIVNKRPFIRALLGNGSGITKAYVYIIQVEEHQYSICDSYDDIGGNRFFPTGSRKNPFVKEKDIVDKKFNTSRESCIDEYESVLTDLSLSMLFDRIYEILFEYNIIKADPKRFPALLNQLFSNPKIKRAIDIGFEELGCYHGSIGNFVDLVITDKNQFNLGNLKFKELKEVISKLKSIGIVPLIENNVIIKARLERYN